MISSAVQLPMDRIAEICRTHNVVELSVFGSVLRDDFDPNFSDVDFLVVFRDNDAGPWLSKYAELEEALSQALGQKVDIVDKHGVEQSENYIRRKHILGSAQVLYVA